MLGPRDLVPRPDNMDETVPHTQINVSHTAACRICLLIFAILKITAVIVENFKCDNAPEWGPALYWKKMPQCELYFDDLDFNHHFIQVIEN